MLWLGVYYCPPNAHLGLRGFEVEALLEHALQKLAPIRQNPARCEIKAINNADPRLKIGGGTTPKEGLSAAGLLELTNKNGFAYASWLNMGCQVSNHNFPTQIRLGYHLTILVSSKTFAYRRFVLDTVQRGREGRPWRVPCSRECTFPCWLHQ